MKRFNFKTLLFLLPIFILAIMLEFALRNIPNDYIFKKKYLDQNSNKIETLILGNSHAYHAFNPVYFEGNAFNAAYFSQPLNYDVKIFEKYQEQTENLKTIVISISYTSLFDDVGERDRLKNYVKFYKIGTTSLANKTELLGRNFSENMKSFVKFYIKNLHPLTSSELGWHVSDSSMVSDLEVTGKEAAIRHTCKIKEEVTNNLINILDSFISYCETRNINVILITLPAYKSYSDNLNEEQLKRTLEISNNFAQKHNNCIYINLLEDTSFTPEDFFDGDHLNDSGAKKISLKISEYTSK